ncbi:MAG TPA: VIT and VWA domain-containing protein [Chthoniobacteraceae bacterium]|jgi:Ca-activated chloride channel family protein|nr:VIT and VWA domain-containing protein [Chthoniobacteraceae bacterium]
MKPKRLSPSQQNFGLVAWLEQTRVALPLKGVECRFQIAGAVAGVELDQIYHQDAAQPLDCTYTFPLPAGAAVYRCELHVNGRVIRAKVEAQEDARRIYVQAKEAGRRAALVETERENLFTLSLGNVQPGDLIVVRFAWFQVLDRAGETMRLLVPTCPGVRYIPGKPLLRGLTGRGVSDDTDQVPDASRISPPRIDALHPDAAYVSIEGRFSAGEVEGGTLSSPSHPIFVRETAGTTTVELSGRNAVPDRDFVVAWREPKARALEPRAWHRREGKETYALVQLRAPEAVEIAAGFSQDVWFLVDRSGSMAGAKWTRTCEALRGFTALLGAEDRVWITLFESEYQDFAEAPMPAPQVLADRGFQQMEGLGTGGGTELLPAARHVLEQIARHSAARRAVVVLITDGQVGNESAVVAAFKSAGHVTVHTFGIDTAVNDAFLKSLARQQRGGCWLQTPDDDIAGTIASLGDRLRRPVLTDLALRGKWEGTGDRLPDLHAGEIATVALRGAAAKSIEVTGQRPDGSEHRFKLGLGAPAGEAIRLLWAKERIAHLLLAGERQEAVALAKKHNLLCEGAAFVAWDEAEQVVIAHEEIVQPAQQPAYAGGAVLRTCLMASPSAGFAGSGRVSELCAMFDDRAPLIRIHEGLAKTRAILRQARIPAKKVDSLLRTFTGADDAAVVRSEALLSAAKLILRFRSVNVSDELRAAFEETLRPLPASCEAMLQWAQIAQRFAVLLGVQRMLAEAKVPAPVSEYLLSWIQESGSIETQRVSGVSWFVRSIARLPISAPAAARQWEKWLGTMEPAARAAAPDWAEAVEPEIQEAAR